jgi:hypothetical protein
LGWGKPWGKPWENGNIPMLQPKKMVKIETLGTFWEDVG